MNYQFTTRKEDLDLDVIHSYLTQSYWAKGIPKDLLARAIQHSFCFGMVGEKGLVAFGRFITDYATFAYLADVFVLPQHRGQGLGKHMMEEALQQPQVSGLRRKVLVTRDAHELYKRFGFQALDQPERFMQQVDPDIYLRSDAE